MKDIIIDCDPGIDDAFALLVALNTKKFNIKMLSTTSGNIPLNVGTKNALHLVEISKADVPVYKGANKPLKGKPVYATEVHQKTGLGNYKFKSLNSKIKGKAISGLYNTIINSDKKITLVAFGPLSNIATLLKKHPDVKNKIKELIIMGTSINGQGNVTETAEFNTYADPYALNYLNDMKYPMTIIPKELGEKAYFTKTQVKQMQNINKAGAILHEMFCGYLLNPGEVEREGAITNHDLCAITYAYDKKMFKTQKSSLTVSLEKKTYGQTFIKPNKDGNITLCLDIDKQKLYEYATCAISKSKIQ